MNCQNVPMNISQRPYDAECTSMMGTKPKLIDFWPAIEIRLVLSSFQNETCLMLPADDNNFIFQKCYSGLFM